MKQLWMGTVVLGAAIVAAPGLAYAQDGDIGKREYVLSCGVCHGDAGKGDGPLVEWLKKTPADLTNIQKNNAGVFPFDRVYEVIDGREAVGTHGPRDMPVWGEQYSVEGAGMMGVFLTTKDIDSFVRGRIIALVGYIYTLQKK